MEPTSERQTSLENEDRGRTKEPKLNHDVSKATIASADAALEPKKSNFRQTKGKPPSMSSLKSKMRQHYPLSNQFDVESRKEREIIKKQTKHLKLSKKGSEQYKNMSKEERMQMIIQQQMKMQKTSSMNSSQFSLPGREHQEGKGVDLTQLTMDALKYKRDIDNEFPAQDFNDAELDCLALMRILPDTWTNVSLTVIRGFQEMIQHAKETRTKMENIKNYSIHVNRCHCKFLNEVLSVLKHNEMNVDRNINKSELRMIKEMGHHYAQINLNLEKISNTND